MFLSVTKSLYLKPQTEKQYFVYSNRNLGSKPIQIVTEVAERFRNNTNSSDVCALMPTVMRIFKLNLFPVPVRYR